MPRSSVLKFKHGWKGVSTFTEVGAETGPASRRVGETLRSIHGSMHSRLTSAATSTVTSRIFSSELSLLPRMEEKWAYKITVSVCTAFDEF